MNRTRKPKDQSFSEKFFDAMNALIKGQGPKSDTASRRIFIVATYFVAISFGMFVGQRFSANEARLARELVCSAIINSPAEDNAIVAETIPAQQNHLPAVPALNEAIEVQKVVEAPKPMVEAPKVVETPKVIEVPKPVVEAPKPVAAPKLVETPKANEVQVAAEVSKPPVVQKQISNEITIELPRIELQQTAKQSRSAEAEKLKNAFAGVKERAVTKKSVVRTASAETERQPSAVVSPAAAAVMGKYSVQLSINSTEDAAKRAVEKLVKLNIDAFYSAFQSKTHGKTMYFVGAGRFDTKEEAVRHQAEIATKYKEATIVHRFK
jgi:hypothetical protein